MSRRALVVAGACGALAACAASGAQASVPTVSLPTVSVPAISVPTVTVPPVTVPSVGVGTVSTPSITTPTVSVPRITTPTISTPTVTVPPVHTSPVSGPTSPSHPVSTGHTPDSQSTASQGTATSAPSGSAAGTSTNHSGSATGRAGAAGLAATGKSSHAASSANHAGQHSGQNSGQNSGTAAAGTQPGGGSGTAHQGSRSSSQTTAATQRPATSAGAFERVVKELPTAGLFALLAFAVIAAVMALNAYLQSRRARSLAGQRAALLSDVGVLQDALLPTVPDSIGDLDVSVAYRPAQGLAAGGDFFDVFSIATGRTGIIVGDVSGHGRESLIHAALVRYTLRTLMGEGHPLPEVLARADRYLIGELGTGFATVIICSYEHPTAELTWAKAGHEPPIIAGEADADEEAATPLGLGLGDTWPQFSRTLVPGERVCLFTDGLVEARRRGEHLGRDHLRALVEEGLTAQALVERIQADADDCTDDLAAVVIGRGIPITALVSPAQVAYTA
jgi:Stage II sporulation protein E (SpoIIE)